MADLTATAVNRQIESMKGHRFEIGIFNASTEMMIIKEWDKNTVIRAVDYCRAQNVKGKHIYIRPAGEHSLSLVDDLSSEALEAMRRDGILPSLIVETSPKNFQAWVNHGRVLPKDLSTECAKELARRYGGDPSSADWRHFGRLAGFTNCKLKHRLPNGYFPFVKVQTAGGGIYSTASALIAHAERNLHQRQLEEAKRRERWRNSPTSHISHDSLKSINDFRNDHKFLGDYHRADMGYAVYAVSHGFTDREIANAISTRDLSHKGCERRQRDYIERTISSARKFVLSPDVIQR